MSRSLMDDLFTFSLTASIQTILALILSRFELAPTSLREEVILRIVLNQFQMTLTQEEL